jgi:hypothetical protein
MRAFLKEPPPAWFFDVKNEEVNAYPLLWELSGRKPVTHCRFMTTLSWGFGCFAASLPTSGIRSRSLRPGRYFGGGLNAAKMILSNWCDGRFM